MNIAPVCIALVGPTASGKTSASLDVARILNCEVISADSRQVYRLLDIGTAKPTIEDQSICTHHFVDYVGPDESYSAGIFAKAALPVVNNLFNTHKIPLIVGGSGLYIQALCEGFFDEPASNQNTSQIRLQLNERLHLEGKDILYDELTEVDVISAKKYLDKNPRRIIRALEFYYTYGIPFSQAHSEHIHTGENQFRTL